MSPAGAQVVEGRVVKEGTDEPVEGVRVELLDGEGERVAVAVTGEGGRFVVGAARPGAYRLRAAHIGYAEVETGLLDLAEDRTTRAVLQVHEAVIPLEPLEVVGEREVDAEAATLEGLYARAGRTASVGRARVLLPGDIELDRSRDLDELVRRVTLQRRVSGGRTCPAVLWNGHRRFGRFGHEIIRQTVSPRELAGVEFYQDGYSAPWFVRAQLAEWSLERFRSCGVLVVWTR